MGPGQPRAEHLPVLPARTQHSPGTAPSVPPHHPGCRRQVTDKTPAQPPAASPLRGDDTPGVALGQPTFRASLCRAPSHAAGTESCDEKVLFPPPQCLGPKTFPETLQKTPRRLRRDSALCRGDCQPEPADASGNSEEPPSTPATLPSRTPAPLVSQRAGSLPHASQLAGLNICTRLPVKLSP